MSTTSEALELFESNLALADRIAARYSVGPGTDDDVRQVARTGLLLAARRFEPDKGVFVRFATVTIIGEVKKHVRQTGWAVRVPRGLQEDALRVGSAIEELRIRLGRSPTTAEVSTHTGLEVSRVVEALRVREARFAEEFEPAGHDRERESDPATAAIVASALSELSFDDSRLIRLRFGEGMTQAEIGVLMGISQAHVHRRLKAAMTKLKQSLEVAGT